MVLESILTAHSAENKYRYVLILGIIISLVAAVMASAVGTGSFLDPSILFITFIVIPSVPLMYGLIKFEEEKTVKSKSEWKVLKEHSKALGAFMFLFFGFILGMVFVFVFFPSDVTSSLFEAPLKTLHSINSNFATGMVAEGSLGAFNTIFFNNLKVLILSVVFSFFFGAGAIFILAWNASVIAVAIGSFIREGMIKAVEYSGLHRILEITGVWGTGLFMFSIHGIPEILAYFTGGLAGGIISVAIVNKEYYKDRFEKVILDSADLFLISIGLLFLAAVLEVWVTPLIF